MRLVFLSALFAMLFGHYLINLNSDKLAANSAWTCTAFFINSEGYIATAGHCVAEAQNMAILHDGKYYPAVLIAGDFENDVAIIKINAESPYYYNINKVNLNPDDLVYILGFPYPQIRGTNLKINDAEVNKVYDDSYLLSGGTCAGNSGGPVVDSKNNAVGVLVASYGGPCAYYVIVEKIRWIIELAARHDVKLYDSENKDFTQEQIFDFGKKAVVLFVGNN